MEKHEVISPSFHIYEEDDQIFLSNKFKKANMYYFFLSFSLYLLSKSKLNLEKAKL